MGNTDQRQGKRNLLKSIMPAYHSGWNQAQGLRIACGMSILPIRTNYKGPAPKHNDNSKPDIIDEALDFFKANVLFRNYEVRGPADRVLVYLTLYISKCLQKIGRNSKGGAEKEMYQLAISNFAVPGDRNFALQGFVQNPKNRAEADQVRQYLQQLRQELGNRLVARIYAQNENVPSKWWMCFAKRKFLNKQL